MDTKTSKFGYTHSFLPSFRSFSGPLDILLHSNVHSRNSRNYLNSRRSFEIQHRTRDFIKYSQRYDILKITKKCDKIFLFNVSNSDINWYFKKTERFQFQKVNSPLYFPFSISLKKLNERKG